MKKFIKLRQQMLAQDIDQSELAHRLGTSNTYVSNRLNGVYPWDAREMANLAKWLKIPTERCYEFFIFPLVGNERKGDDCNV